MTATACAATAPACSSSALASTRPASSQPRVDLTHPHRERRARTRRPIAAAELVDQQLPKPVLIKASTVDNGDLSSNAPHGLQALLTDKRVNTGPHGSELVRPVQIQIASKQLLKRWELLRCHTRRLRAPRWGILMITPEEFR